ncbi:MAG: ferredoxin-thioredoxin reductase catalytic domain-containing protein [Planctomycetota bacterium]
MDLTPEAQAIKKRLDAYLAGTPYTYSPDKEAVARVLNGMARRKEKQGEAYCPCRIVTGEPEADRKIICPCVYHEDEIARDGHCHCRLFVREDATGGD